MTLIRYRITALPFAMSDATSEYFEYAENEEMALEQFVKRYPAWRVKEVEAA